MTSSDSDLKELTPEWFFQPAFLVNANALDLGTRQCGARVGDVALPPWARGSAERFVSLHRAALEGEHVSRQVHRWSDLIFGHAQRGPAAEKHHNVFYHLTYEDAVDLDASADPVLRRAAEIQIANFGQTPSQLFTRPHPPHAWCCPAADGTVRACCARPTLLSATLVLDVALTTVGPVERAAVRDALARESGGSPATLAATF